MSENTELKKRIKELEEKNLELASIAKETGLSFDKVKMPYPKDIQELSQLRQVESLKMIVHLVGE
jgi:hypothetical protein